MNICYPHTTARLAKVLMIAGLLSLSSSLSQANCSSHFFDQQPVIPDGRTASKAEMLAVQGEVKAYINRVEGDIRCIKNEFVHDTDVKQLRKLGQRYNAALNEHRQANSLATR